MRDIYRHSSFSTHSDRRMALAQHAYQMLLCDVRVPLCRGDGGVPEKLLHYTDVHAVAQEQCRHRVTKHVRRHVPLDTRLLPGLCDDVRAVFPRAKLCAGGLSPSADRALSQLGLVGGPSSIPVHKAILILPTGRLTFEQLNLSRVVSREQFDNFLLQSARQRGVTVQDGEAVEHVLSARDEVIVRTSRDEYRTKILIAADGANSTVRGRMGLKRAGRVMAASELHAPLADLSASRC
jgi:hypothetical protein